MSETRYIPDTRFAAKLQELVNEFCCNKLESAKTSAPFRHELNLLYMREQQDLVTQLYLDALAGKFQEEVEDYCGAGDLFKTVFGSPSTELSEAIFEDFSNYWDSGEADEVIPYSRFWSKAQRDCEATRANI